MKKQQPKTHLLALCCTILLACSWMNATQAQTGSDIRTKTVTIGFTNEPLRDALFALGRVAGFQLAFPGESVADVTKTVNLPRAERTVEATLNLLLQGTNLEFQVNGNNVVLSERNIATRVATTPAQQLQITGRVIDDGTNEPLPFVTIQVRGTTIGTVTSVDGTFALTVPSAEGVLLFSLMGYETFEVPVDVARPMAVRMSETAIMLEGVMVTGFQTISRERATGSFSIIDQEHLERPTTNIGQRLAGQMAGLQTMTDLDGNTRFEIRGQGTLHNPLDIANIPQPLIVVDGFPIRSGIESLNPNDIESINVLKDAAAASIWGAQAANGVIVITTRRAANRGQGLRVDVNSFVRVSPTVDIDYLRPFASSSEVVDYQIYQFPAPFWPQGPPGGGSTNAELIPSIPTAIMLANEHRLGRISYEEMNARLNELRGLDNRNQIRDLMFQRPFAHQHNITVSNNGDRAQSILSIMYEGSNGFQRLHHRDRYTVDFRTNAQVLRWLDFNFGGFFGLTNDVNPFRTGVQGQTIGFASLSPYEMLLNPDGSYRAVPHMFYMPNLHAWVPMDDFPYTDWTYNPAREMHHRDMRSQRLNGRMQFGLTFRLMEGLNIQTRFQYEYMQTMFREHFQEESFFVRHLINTTSTWNRTTGVVQNNIPMGGMLDQRRDQRAGYTWRTQLNFDRTFATEHRVTFLAGFEMADIVFQRTDFPRVAGFNKDRLSVGTWPRGVGGAGNLAIQGWTGFNQNFQTGRWVYSFAHQTERYFSAFGNVSYTFRDRYTVTASARTDASNMITDDPRYRFAPFWHIGGIWNISDEEFMRTVPWINRLAIRATYGHSGNVDRTTSFMPLINLQPHDPFIQDYTAAIQSFGNPTLRWERTKKANVGFDFSLFNNRLFGKLDLYNHQGTDIIVQKSMPLVHGTGTQRINAAEMVNRGIELELGTRARISRNISWLGSVNMAYNHNRITNLFRINYHQEDLTNGGIASYVEGFNASTLWSFVYAGLNEHGVPTIRGSWNAAENRYNLYNFMAFAPGDARGFTVGSGPATAPFLVNLSSSFRIHDFNVSFLFTGKFGHVFRGFTYNYPATRYPAIPNRLLSEVMNADHSVAPPVRPLGGVASNFHFWDRFFPFLDCRIQSANHVRLSEVNISYNIPNRILDRIGGIRSVRIYAQGNNLLLIHNNLHNEDPEFPMDRTGALRPRASFTFGVNLSF